MKWRDFTVQQKLLLLVAISVVITAFFILLDIWGFEIPKDLLGKIIGTFLVVGLVAGILIAINSNMKEARKDDKDNFFN